MAILSNGTTFSYDGGAVADVLSISTPSVTTATIDTTGIESVHRTFLAGTIDSGEMTLEIMYDPTLIQTSRMLGIIPQQGRQSRRRV